LKYSCFYQAVKQNSEIPKLPLRNSNARVPPPALPEQMAEASAVISIRAQDQHDCRLVDRLAEPQFSLSASCGRSTVG
jgi:hypothetical protein